MNSDRTLTNISSDNSEGTEYDSTKESSNNKVCYYCGSMPCDWITMGEELIQDATERYVTNESGQQITSTGQVVLQSKIRKTIYRKYTRLRYGKLGASERIPLPICVESAIKNAFPEPDDTYMGFKEN